MDYSRLIEAIRECKACPLGSRGAGVPGAYFLGGERIPHGAEGEGEPQVMIIAEAPGDVEQHVGWPVQGSSGQLMHSLLQEVGLTFYYVSNTVKHQPPKVTGKQSAPDQIATQACAPFLRMEIEMVQPERFILLGKTAMKLAVPGNFSVGSMVNREVEYLGRPTLLLYHPAHFLYQRTSRGTNKQIKDWKAAVQLFLGTAEIPEYKIKEVVCPTHSWPSTHPA